MNKPKPAAVQPPMPPLSERTDYIAKRVIERFGMDIDAAMRAKGLTIADVAKAAGLTREVVASLLDGTADDIDIRTMVDVAWACGQRVQFSSVRDSLVRPL